MVEVNSYGLPLRKRGIGEYSYEDEYQSFLKDDMERVRGERTYKEASREFLMKRLEDVKYQEVVFGDLIGEQGKMGETRTLD